MNASTYCENKNFYSLLFQTSSEHFFSCQSCLDSSPYLHHHFDCSSYSTILTTLFSCWKTIEHSSHPTPQEKKYSTLKEGLREGEKKRKGKERCKSSLQQEVKAYTLKLFPNRPTPAELLMQTNGRFWITDCLWSATSITPHWKYLINMTSNKS